MLVFPAGLAPSEDSYIPFDKGLFLRLLNNSRFIDRNEAENSNEFKQLIPYIALINSNGQVFSYQRTSKQKESRLRSLFSIGIGGHINPVDEDISAENTFYNSAIREVREELGIKVNSDDFEHLCFVNDNSNSVGRVHFGVCLALKMDFIPSTIEDTMTGAKFLDVESCMSDLENYETWSRFFITYLNEERQRL